MVRLGALSVIALYWTYVGTQILPTLQREMIVMNERLLQGEKADQELRSGMERIYVVTLQLCSNMARTSDERNACFKKRE